MKNVSRVVLTSSLALLTLQPITSHAHETDEINLGHMSLDVGLDATSEYWFRGIGQENQGVQWQPAFTVGATLHEDEATGESLSAYFSSWNSYHTSAGASVSSSDEWYESDIAFGIVLEKGDLTYDLSFITYYNPDGGGIFAEELALSVAYDDAAFWEEHGFEGYALSPYVTLAVEVDGGADAGTEMGTYLELGIEPSWEIAEGSTPITLSVPVTLGLSLDNYYEDGTGDQTFGYLQAGVVLSAPVGVPASYGQWESHVGVYANLLGDHAQNISGAFGAGSDDVNVWFGVGFSVSY